MSTFLVGVMGFGVLGLGSGALLGSQGWRPWAFRGLVLLALVPWLGHHAYLFDRTGLFVFLAPERILALPSLFWTGLAGVTALSIPVLLWPQRLRLPAVLLPVAAGASISYLVLPACWARGLELFRCAPDGPPLMDNAPRIWLAWVLTGGAALLAGYVGSAHLRERREGTTRSGARTPASTPTYEV